MKTIGLPISKKENEYRRALVPGHLKLIKNPTCLFVETGYGNKLGFSDFDYSKFGVNIVSREDVLSKNIICDPKIGDAEYLGQLNHQIIFGWIHAVQNRDITDAIIKSQLTAYAWEDMFEKGRHCFWKNNEMAGYAAVFHAYICHGVCPYNTKVAILGRGNTARGAYRALYSLGAQVTVYDRNMEQLFRDEIGLYDVVVNAILWDTSRKDHILYKQDLKRMKKGALIIDISCDSNGAVETSIPTTIDDPTYIVDGITHYVVDHTPSLFYKSVSETLSEQFVKYADLLINGREDEVLLNCKIIEEGVIRDQRINAFQKR